LTATATATLIPVVVGARCETAGRARIDNSDESSPAAGNAAQANARPEYEAFQTVPVIVAVAVAVKVQVNV
jgi:hypothetical protein